MLARIQAFAANRDNFSVHASLGRMRYLSVMHHVDAVVGNSSSGIIEAPAMHTPTVNIGNRQKGRPLAASVIQVDVDSGAIMAAIKNAISLEQIQEDNPYGDGNAAQRIIAALDEIDDFPSLTAKQFVDI
jgi:UDP-N-acetylglucosamine 2-epimerase